MATRFFWRNELVVWGCCAVTLPTVWSLTESAETTGNKIDKLVQIEAYIPPLGRSRQNTGGSRCTRIS